MNNNFINCSITINDNKTISLKGNIINPSNFKSMYICASNPIFNISSFSGRNLPYPSYYIAFDNTLNHYNINNDGIIDTIFQYPNSYYDETGINKIPPTIYFHLDNNVYSYKLPDLFINKTLTDRFRTINNGTSDPSFYAKKEFLLSIDTSENIMYEYSKLKISNNIA